VGLEVTRPAERTTDEIVVDKPKVKQDGEVDKSRAVGEDGKILFAPKRPSLLGV
jgi:hypothetical protein